jgi:hypothetical protein
MKDLPMFNKLFFVLCSSLLIALTSPSAAEEPTYITIQGSGGEYEVFGTEQEARSVQNRLSSNKTIKYLKKKIRHNQMMRGKYSASDVGVDWSHPDGKRRLVSMHADYDNRIAKFNRQIEAQEQKITAPMGEQREKKYKADKIAEAKAKLIEDARIVKIAALAKIAAAKKIEDAQIAAAKKKEEARIALVMEEYRKQQLEKKISSVLKIIAGINGPKDPNKITSITKDGQVRTLYCSSACTPGSVKLHEIITGIPMGVDVGTLTKRIEANAAQGKRQDNTNENNAKAAEDIASQGNVSIDTLFEQAEADIATHDTSFARAQSIPLGQRIRNREAHTEYVRSQSENEAYCLYEGC